MFGTKAEKNGTTARMDPFRGKLGTYRKLFLLINTCFGAYGIL